MTSNNDPIVTPENRGLLVGLWTGGQAQSVDDKPLFRCCVEPGAQVDPPPHIISAERLRDQNAIASITIKAAELIAMIDLAGNSDSLDTARQHATEAAAWAERHFANE